MKRNEEEARRLVSLIADVDDRIDALKAEKDQYKDRLHLLMDELGESMVTSKEGEAVFKRRRAIKVHTPEALVELFSSDVLAAHFKPPITFIEACREQNIDIDRAVTVGRSEFLEVSRTRDAQAKERRAKIIEESRRSAQATVRRFKEQLTSKKGKTA